MNSQIHNTHSARLFLFIFLCFVNQKLHAQIYTGTIDHDGIYTFDFTIECGTPSNTALVTLEYTTSEPPGVVPQLHLGGGVFVNMTGPSPYTYTLSGLTDCDFSFEFYIAWMAGGLYQSPTPVTQTTLPIELVEFNLREDKDGSVIVDWLTEVEINSDYFSIHRSINGIEWEAIGMVKALGNSLGVNRYTFLDDAPNYSSEGYSYYRLKMVDLDGSFAFSPVQVLRHWNRQEIPLDVFPNPVSSYLFFDFSQIDWTFGNVILQVYNIHGQKILSDVFTQTDTHTLRISSLPSAVYFFRFSQRGRLISQRKVTVRQ